MIRFFGALLIPSLVFQIVRSRFRSLLDPRCLLLLAWSVPAGFSLVKARYPSYLSHLGLAPVGKGWLAVLGAIAAFCLGTTVISRSTSRTIPSHPFVRPDRVVRVGLRMSILCTAIGAVAWIQGAVLAGGVPLLGGGTQVLEQKSRFREGGLADLFVFLFVAIILAEIVVVVSLVYGVARRRRRLAVAVLLGNVAAVLVSAQRVEAWQALMVGAVVSTLLVERTHLFSRARRLVSRRAVLAGVALVAASIAVGFVRFDTTDSPNTLQTNPAWLSSAYPYTYEPSVRNLALVMDGQIRVPPGPPVLLRSVALLPGVEYKDVTGDLFDGPNTASWLLPYWIDLGLAGVIVVPFGLGLVCGAVHRSASRRRHRSGAFGLAAYGVLASCIVLSPATERFFEPNTIIYVVALSLALGRLFRAGSGGVALRQDAANALQRG